jgi:hypothetical protein
VCTSFHSDLSLWTPTVTRSCRWLLCVFRAFTGNGVMVKKFESLMRQVYTVSNFCVALGELQTL